VTDPHLDVELHHRLGRIDLDVRLAVGRETLALIGPSGVGKSSVLRAIAGLLTPKKGRIVCDGRPLLDTQRRVDLPPEERRVGLVFQDGALFPHLSVAQNIAYGLRPRSGGRRERRARVAEILERFTIAPLADSKPTRISGGERQRVAIARAVATSPDVLLLDEPLSALDTVTKSHVAAELSRILTGLRLPTILVSHDFGDVAGLAERVAVMDAGRIVQTGTTAELLRAPASAFVAAFVGTNYFLGEARRAADTTVIDLDEGGRVVSDDAAVGRVAVVVQPWHVAIGDPAVASPDANALIGPITSVAPRGGTLRVAVASTPAITVDVAADAPVVAGLTVGAVVAATWPPALTRLVPPA
jgi:ABC-type sulfate/molybdate transport systems ATPase subunit